jgi:hypothetical protein
MWPVDVETPPAKTTTAEASASETAAPWTCKPTTAAESSTLLPSIIEALLHFVSAHGIK